MQFYKDSQNIGWAGCVHINPHDITILLVKNLKREAQVRAELVRQGHESEEEQKLNLKRITYELSHWGPSKKSILEKPGKWELLGGKIAYWQGNPKLQSEFNSLSEEAQKEFEEEIGLKVLHDDKLLTCAADSTADSEFVEEGGLIVKEKLFLTHINDPDRNYPKSSEIWYPRFWYLVTSAAGKLRTEPVKDSISEPHWIPIMQLHPKFEDENHFPFHPSHVLGVFLSAKYFIKNGRPEFAEVVNYLEKTYGKQDEVKKIEETDNWESFTKTVDEGKWRKI